MKNEDDDIPWYLSGDERAFYRKVEEEIAIARSQAVEGEDEAATNKRVKDWMLSQLERIRKEVKEERDRYSQLGESS